MADDFFGVGEIQRLKKQDSRQLRRRKILFLIGGGGGGGGPPWPSVGMCTKFHIFLSRLVDAAARRADDDNDDDADIFTGGKTEG